MAGWVTPQAAASLTSLPRMATALQMACFTPAERSAAVIPLIASDTWILNSVTL
jgi:hypothetical protein